MDQQEKTLENLREVAADIRRREALPPPDTDRTRESPGQPWAIRLAKWGGLGLVLAAILGKLKFVLIALKFLKFSSILTMLFSIYAYSTLWGWSFAFGFVLLIMIHELGHGIVMRMHGIPAGAPIFIPFVGALIAMKGRPRDAYVEAKVAFGGPVLGSLGTIVCLLIWMTTRSDLWRSLAFSGFLINLFNLLPVGPLDGGRIVGAIDRRMWVLGFALGIPIFLLTKSPILLLVLVLGLFGILRKRSDSERYFDIPPQARRTLAVAYFGIVALLAIGVALTHLTVK